MEANWGHFMEKPSGGQGGSGAGSRLSWPGALTNAMVYVLPSMQLSTLLGCW